MINAVTAPLNRIFTNEIKISVSNIWVLIDACHARKQTGVIRLIFEEGRALYLFLKHGNVVNSYIVSSQTWESVSSELWYTWVNSAGTAYTKLIPLSPQGLLILKLLIQSTAGKTETFTHSSDIGKYLESQKKSPAISLVQFEWEDSIGAVLLSGLSESPYSLFISSESLHIQSNITPAILNPESPYCTVTTFGINQSVEAWQEYLLRRAFANICERTLSRIQMMTGSALVDSLIRLIIVFASRRGLNIDISLRKVMDGEVFSSPQQAADNYRALLTEMLTHLSGITGSRLLSSTLREVVANLSVQERTVIAAFPLFTEGYFYERRN